MNDFTYTNWFQQSSTPSTGNDSSADPKIPYVRKCIRCGNPVVDNSFNFCENCGVAEISSTMENAKSWVEIEISWIKGYYSCYIEMNNKKEYECKLEIRIDSYITGKNNCLGINVYGLIDGVQIKHPRYLYEREFKQGFNIEIYWMRSKKYSEEVANGVNRIMRKAKQYFQVNIVSDTTLMLCTTCNELTHGKYDGSNTKIKECHECAEERRIQEVKEASIKLREKWKKIKRLPDC